MLFNSISFALFLPLIFLLYWYLGNKSIKHQNTILLIASYFFYACWDIRFLLLLIFSTSVDFFAGLKIASTENERTKKLLLWVTICINLGLLSVFKYFNFFVSTFSQSINYLGLETNTWTLNIILPVGISFYTFHGLSYIIDIYKGKIPPEYRFINYSLFVSFFPLLVAGPIERASHLLPQIASKRSFNRMKATDGLRQIMWGLVKKMVIADQCAEYVNLIFNDSASHSGSTLALGAFFFAFQIYGDFSGYSDIALGTAKLFGIDLLRNFAFPYFSRDIAEFWRRWHISLATWFRDYLYIPLGGSKGKLVERIRNLFVIFVVSGFWHGANWTFILWGALNALFILPSLLIKNTKVKNIEIVAKGRMLPNIRELFQMLSTFFLISIGWIIFRADNLVHALEYFTRLFSSSFFTLPEFDGRRGALVCLILVALFMIIEWTGREYQYAIEKIGLTWPKFIRRAFYFFVIFLTMMYMETRETPFIYFQF